MAGTAGSLPSLPFARPNPLEPPVETARLRAAAAMSRVLTPAGEPAWLVTRYDEARMVLTDERFRLAIPGLGDEASGQNDSLFQDPPGHTRLRRLVSAAFTPRRVEALRARTTEIATGLIDAMLASGPPVDLAEAFAFPLPITVIGELLGVPDTDRDHFRAWSDALMALPVPGGTDPGTGWANLTAHVTGLIADKRANPGDDLLSALIAVRDRDDGRLTDAELMMMAITLIPAGYVTTSTAIMYGLVLLTANAGFAPLATDPALVAGAVEEILRYQTAAGEVARVATADLRLGGADIAAGDKVLVSLSSANRDERHFADPDRFDITRADATHLTFGQGIHHCLGAGLARLELQVAFTTLADRLPTLRTAIPADELTWQRSELFGDEYLSDLPITW